MQENTGQINKGQQLIQLYPPMFFTKVNTGQVNKGQVNVGQR